MIAERLFLKSASLEEAEDNSPGREPGVEKQLEMEL